MAWSVAGEGRPANAVGKVGAVVADILFHGFGYFAFALPLLVIAKLGQLFRRASPNSGRVWVLRLIGVTLSVTSLCALAEMSIWDGADLPVGAGGILGRSLVAVMLPLFSFTGSAVLLTGALAMGLMLFLEFSWLALFDTLGGWLLDKGRFVKRSKPSEKPTGTVAPDRKIAPKDDTETAEQAVESAPKKFTLFRKKSKTQKRHEPALEPDIDGALLMPDWDQRETVQDDLADVGNIPLLLPEKDEAGASFPVEADDGFQVQPETVIKAEKKQRLCVRRRNAASIARPNLRRLRLTDKSILRGKRMALMRRYQFSRWRKKNHAPVNGRSVIYGQTFQCG